MKFIKEDGMVIEEEDGIIHTWELLSRIAAARKENKIIRAHNKKVRATAKKVQLNNESYCRQKEINKHLQTHDPFNIIVFVFLLLLFWPGAFFYAIWYIFKRGKNGKK